MDLPLVKLPMHVKDLFFNHHRDFLRSITMFRISSAEARGTLKRLAISVASLHGTFLKTDDFPNNILNFK
jgi:hypothetical protein